MKQKATDFIEQVEDLCGRTLDKLVVRNAVDRLTAFFDAEGVKARFGHRQLNEVLLLLNERIVTKGFFELLASLGKGRQSESITFDDFPGRVQEFRKLAMLKYGSFRFAYNFLSAQEDPKEHLKDWLRKSPDLVREFKSRQRPLCEVEEISIENIHHIGYLSSTQKNKAVRKKIRAIGRRNFDTYLTWDYLDVYVATSMRRPFEYRAVHRLCDSVFRSKRMRNISIRYFDPTLNFHEDSIAKSLIEGLMLKRAKCTLYLAQESDTMGKDSELAATLAQGKPVVAYVPRVTSVGSRVKELKDAPLDELLVLAKVVEETVSTSDSASFRGFVDTFEEIMLSELEPSSKQREIASHKREFESLVTLIAKYEKVFYDNRADKLKYAHPLRFQMDLQTGVANGVLVARSPEQCESLVYKLLTCDLKFEIIAPNQDCVDKKKFGTALKHNHLLIETSTRSAFRVVTSDDKLTNSFWNLYKRDKREKS